MRFKKVYIEITNICNLKCSFCIQNSRKERIMSVKEFDHILNQIKPYTKYIYLHILGEPLSHPYLKEILEVAHQYDMFVNITTNGTLLSKNLEILLKSPAVRQINVSLHSFPNINNYLMNVTYAGDKLSESGIYVSYRLWTIKNELTSEMKETIKYLNHHYQTEILFESKSFKLKDHTFISFDKEFKWPTCEDVMVGDRGTCHGFKNMVGIHSNGNIVPCCLDGNGECVLGNIFNEPFDEFLNRYEYLLNEMRNQKLSLKLCQHCTYRLRFSK